MCSCIAHDNCVVCVCCFLRCLYPSFYIKGGEVIRKITLSLLTYFTYIFIDIIIYALGSTPWSSGIFLMVYWVIADSSLNLLSLCGVVSWVPILVNSSRVLDKWVDAEWSGLSLSVMNLPSNQFQELSTLAWNWWVLFHRIDRIGAPITCSPQLSN
jgi:hypothetical protein